jgi:RND family efflux transporter MFP subunit
LNIHRWLIATLVILIIISGLGFFKYQQVQAMLKMAESFPEPSATVGTVVTEISTYTPSIMVTGQAVATKVVVLQNELPGVIDHVAFSAGDFVTKGQLLLSQNTVEEKARLDAALASLKLARNNFERMQSLVKSNKVSQQQYDSADAEFKIAKANIVNLESIIAKKQFRAPFGGQLGLESYQVGQYLAANTNITSLVDDEPIMWIDFQLSQTQRQLALGDLVYVAAIHRDNNHSAVAAKIIAKSGQVTAQSRHMKYRAELPNGREWLSHNEIVKIQVPEVELQAAVVPAAAVVRNQSEAFVFELIMDETKQYRATALPVQLGTRDGDNQVILSGVSAGLLIATEGAFKLREGLLVYPELLPEPAITTKQSYGDTLK